MDTKKNKPISVKPNKPKRKTHAKKKKNTRRKSNKDKDKQSESDGNKPENKDTKTGRFLPGNKAAVGKGGARAKQKLNQEFRDCATSDDIQAFYNKLKTMALDGNLTAMGIILDRLMGRPEVQAEVIIDDSTDHNVDETFL